MNNFNDANINSLLHLSFIRLKERFLNYFLTWIIVLVFYFILFIPLGLGLLIKKILPSTGYTQILVLVYTLINIVVMAYATTWSQLALTNIIINQEKMGPISSYKYTRSLVKDYFIFNILLWFFFLLLFPVFVGTLFIGLLFWYVFLPFCVFIYLEKGKKGLDILWYSKALVQKNKIIFLYIFVIWILSLIIEFVIPSGRNISLIICKQIISFLIIPFTTSFMYEVYKDVHEPVEIKSPKSWFIAGFIGWIVILFVLLIFAIFFKANIRHLYNKTLTNSQQVITTPTPTPVNIGFWGLNKNVLSIDIGNKKIGNSALEQKNNVITSSSIKLVEGKIDKAGRFSGGNNSYVQLPGLMFIENIVEGDFSVSLWASRFSRGNNVLVSTTNDKDGGFAVLTGNAGEVYCRTSNGYSYIDSYTDYDGRYFTANSGWHHLVIVRKNQNCDIYIDGINRTHVRGNHSIIEKSNNLLTIGSSPIGKSSNDSMFQGDIDDIKIYNYAQTQEEIKQDMTMVK